MNLMLMNVRKMDDHQKTMNNILSKIGAILSILSTGGLLYTYLVLIPEYVPRQMFDVNALNNFMLSAIVLFVLMSLGFILKIVGKR